MNKRPLTPTVSPSTAIHVELLMLPQLCLSVATPSIRLARDCDGARGCSTAALVRAHASMHYCFDAASTCTITITCIDAPLLRSCALMRTSVVIDANEALCQETLTVEEVGFDRHVSCQQLCRHHLVCSLNRALPVVRRVWHHKTKLKEPFFNHVSLEVNLLQQFKLVLHPITCQYEEPRDHIVRARVHLREQMATGRHRWKQGDRLPCVFPHFHASTQRCGIDPRREQENQQSTPNRRHDKVPSSRRRRS
jgi:hypothetical protein